MTAGRTNHTQFASAAPNMGEAELRAFIFGDVQAQHVADPCPSCDGDEYDNASGECSECGHTDSEGGETE